MIEWSKLVFYRAFDARIGSWTGLCWRAGSGRLWLAAFAVALCIASGLSGAEAAGSPQTTVVQATPITEAQAPKIDGSLSDPVWAKVSHFDRFHQIEPDNGAAPTERTVIYIAYDKYNLYIGIHAYDTHPDQIIARYKARDSDVYKDDEIRVSIDPDRTRRDAYNFQINPIGGYQDALIQNTTTFIKPWNPVWRHAARLTSDGWTAEMEIPFRILSYDPNSSKWGISIIRFIPRRQEIDRMVLTAANVGKNDMSYEAILSGLHGMSQGLGVKLEVYGLGRYTRKWLPHQSGITSRYGGTAYYNITPALTGAITVNTDFSRAPLDKRQVNTTRFSLFTPETRQFFLQDAAAFEFGGEGLNRGPFFGNVLYNGNPYFSRNIGLVHGNPVGVLGGGKLSGALGPVDVGALTVRTEASAVAPAEQLSVARISMPVLAESKMGIIVTNGDPTGLSKNTVTGGDFQYYNSNFLPNKRLRADFYFLRSFSSVLGDDNEGGVTIDFPNEPFGGVFFFKHLGANFSPALGFANRVGINDYRGALLYRKRFENAYLRWVEAGTKDMLVTGLDGTVQSRENTGWVNASSFIGDSLTVYVSNSFENILVPFYLPGNILVPAGRYSWTHVHPKLQTSDARPIALTLEVDCCRFYDGTYLMTDATIDWRINRTLILKFEHRMDRIHLPTGRANIQVAQLTLDINFTPDMQLETQVQYDNVTNHFQLLARYRWQYSPGQEIFASIGESSLIEGPLTAPFYHPQETQAEFRIGHTFLF